MLEVFCTDEFIDWYKAQTSDEALMDDIDHVVRLLQERGTSLGFPQSSAIKQANPLRELRIQSRGRPIRVFYAFDPKRDAVLLLGGDKTGEKRFYEQMVPKALKLWALYLDELKERI
jgi:hypothetical protein